MSELNVYHHELRPNEYAEFYLKYEADKMIADLEESHKMEVEQLLMEIVELKEIDSKNRSAYYKDLAMMAKDVEKYKTEKAELEEELVASKRKEKESRELADPYTLYCEASADVLRKALGEYRWRRTCDERPPEWSCVIVYFHDEESREEQYRLAVYSKENGWEVDDEEVYKTAEIEAWHPLPIPPEEEQ